MAPALIIGLKGAPDSGRRLMALKASPEGSTPMRLRMNSSPRSSSASPYDSALETDCMVKCWRVSPTSYTCPSRVAMQMPNQSGLALVNSGM